MCNVSKFANPPHLYANMIQHNIIEQSEDDAVVKASAFWPPLSLAGAPSIPWLIQVDFRNAISPSSLPLNLR